MSESEGSSHVRGLSAATVKAAAPWAVSVLLHVLLIFVAVVATWTVVSLQREREPVVIVADFEAMSFQPLSPARMNAAAQGASSSSASGAEMLDVPLDSTPGFETGATDLMPMPELGGAWDVAGGRGELEGGMGDGMGGEKAEFLGLKGSNARRVVYVIDASGSMMRALQIVVDELERSLERLSPEQSYGVIFFQRNDALVVPPGGRLVAATLENKMRSMRWIRADRNVIPAGRSNPIKALERAMALDPDVVFLLSENITGSGEFEIDQKDLLGLIEKLNPADAKTGRRPTQIKCIQFLDADPLDTLRKIGELHGGEGGYRFLDRGSLGLGG